VINGKLSVLSLIRISLDQIPFPILPPNSSTFRNQKLWGNKVGSMNKRKVRGTWPNKKVRGYSSKGKRLYAGIED